MAADVWQQQQWPSWRTTAIRKTSIDVNSKMSDRDLAVVFLGKESLIRFNTLAKLSFL
jgi:hypothetical protein